MKVQVVLLQSSTLPWGLVAFLALIAAAMNRASDPQVIVIRRKVIITATVRLNLHAAIPGITTAILVRITSEMMVLRTSALSLAIVRLTALTSIWTAIKKEKGKAKRTERERVKEATAAASVLRKSTFLELTSLSLDATLV